LQSVVDSLTAKILDLENEIQSLKDKADKELKEMQARLLKKEEKAIEKAAPMNQPSGPQVKQAEKQIEKVIPIYQSSGPQVKQVEKQIEIP
jgi:predicted subunit of tRNA(5-methylaminomethyl-2-thiouridylate) methyltransferase